MKTFQLSVVLLFFSFLILRGQENSRKYGVVGSEELKLKEYEKDPEAEALVLYDVGCSYFIRKESSYDLVFERTTRIKILDESGIDWSEIEIPFYREGNIRERVYDIEATTYNLKNGGVSKTNLDPAATFEEQLNDYWIIKKFAMPNVKAGSVIEYRYKIESPYKFNLRDWEFQWQIPVLYSEYEVSMIPFYEYIYLLQGRSKFDHQESYVQKGVDRQFGSISFQDMVHKLVMKDVPSFRDEAFISSINDYIIKVDFQLAKINYPTGVKVDIQTTWEELIEERIKHKDFGKYISKSEKIVSKLTGMTWNENQPEEERFNAVIDYFKTNYSWNEHMATYASKSANDFAADKLGNCADMNLFTVGALRSAGIKAHPILISTREHGKIKSDYPFSHFFNYVIVMAEVGGKVILTDVTDSYCMNDRIPERCINDNGLVVMKDQVEWLSLNCSGPSARNSQFSVEWIGEKCNVEMSQSFTEYDAIFYRKAYTEEPDAVASLLDSEGGRIDKTSISVQNISRRDQPLIFEYEFSDEPEVINDKIYLSPFFNRTAGENPLKQRTRTYPVDMTYPRKRTFTATIPVPDGFEVDYLPDETKIKNQEFEMEYKILENEGHLTVLFNYYFKNSVYPVSSYKKIRYYYDELVKKGNDQIVFSRVQTSSP
jgi:hypothetical protein